MVCPPIRGDNLQAFVEDYRPYSAQTMVTYTYFIITSSVLIMLNMKYVLLKFAISNKDKVMNNTVIGRLS